MPLYIFKVTVYIYASYVGIVSPYKRIVNRNLAILYNIQFSMPVQNFSCLDKAMI